MKRFLLSLACVVLLASSVSAQVAFDAVANGACDGAGGGTTCAGSTNTLTFAMTVGSGSNRALACFVTVAGSSGTVQPAISTITYAGVSLTQVVHQGTNYYTDLWSLPAGTQPTSGTNNVVVTLASGLAGGSDVLLAGCISATGVDQTTTFTVTGSNSGSGTTASVTLGASGANDLVIHSSCSGTSMNSTPQTSRWVNNFSILGACGTHGGATAAGGTTSLSWSISSDSWEMVAAAFKAASGGGGGGSTPARLPLLGVGARWAAR